MNECHWRTDNLDIGPVLPRCVVLKLAPTWKLVLKGPDKGCCFGQTESDFTHCLRPRQNRELFPVNDMTDILKGNLP